ncbi:effector-associated constant component EACC1 [Streptosporangium soli]|nr:hypothetical protein [Streptosporangium sp. KLBMP 9127]
MTRDRQSDSRSRHFLQVLVTVEDEDFDQEDGLPAWLQGDHLGPDVSLSPPLARPEDMGIADTIQATLDNVTGLGALITSILAWRQSRSRNNSQPRIFIYVKKKNQEEEIFVDLPYDSKETEIIQSILRAAQSSDATEVAATKDHEDL